MWYSWNKNACKTIKTCTRCRKPQERKYYANGEYWNYRDNVCFFCLFWTKKYQAKPRESIKEDIDLLKEIIETEKITWFSRWLIKKFLKEYTHSEIRKARVVNGKVYIDNLY